MLDSNYTFILSTIFASHTLDDAPFGVDSSSCSNPLIVVNPSTSLNGSFQFDCYEGILSDCSMTIDTGCFEGIIPMAWIAIETDEDAVSLYLNVSTSCGWNPVFAIFEGTCPDGLQTIGSDDSPACNVEWINPEQINQHVAPNSTFWW